MAKKVVRELQVGDRVRLLHTQWPPARVVEVHGPLGPGGAMVYRVRTGRKRNPIYIDIRADQVELLPPEE